MNKYNVKVLSHKAVQLLAVTVLKRCHGHCLLLHKQSENEYLTNIFHTNLLLHIYLLYKSH